MPSNGVVAELVLERDRLGRTGDVLGRGGQATVHELPDLTLPDTSGPLVFKKYRQPHPSSGNLRKIVSARFNLDGGRRAHLDEIATWPIRVVEEKGVTVGLVMRRIPPDYFDRVTLVGTGKVKFSPREVQNLFIDPARGARLGRPMPADGQRIRICRDFAASLRFYHEDLKFVFGDVNAKNEVYRLTARPTVLFLDCDGVRTRGSLGGADQLNSPDWVPPEAGGLSWTTDLYKLGLFILRCLAPGPLVSTGTDPTAAAARLDSQGADMLRRAVGSTPDGRPTAAEWHVYLSGLLGEPQTPPILRDAALDRTYVCTGQPVTCTWRADNALAIELVTAGGAERVDGRAGSGTVALTLRDSSFIRVRAINDLGADEKLLGPVAVVRSPRSVSVPVPMPELVTTSTGHLPVPDPKLPAMPSITLPALPMSLSGLLDAEMPVNRRSPSELSDVRSPIDPTSVLDGPRIDTSLLNSGKTT